MNKESKKKIKNIFEKSNSDKELVFDLTNEVNDLHQLLDKLKREGVKDSYALRERRMINNMVECMKMKIKAIANCSEKIKSFIAQKAKEIQVHEPEEIVPDHDFSQYLQQNSANALDEEIRRQERKELEQLSDSIYQLHQFFFRMNEMVVYQGTLVDRIDHNLSCTLVDVDRGNIELRKAIQHQNDGCATWCIRLEFGFVLLLSILLLIKYS